MVDAMKRVLLMLVLMPFAFALLVSALFADFGSELQEAEGLSGQGKLEEAAVAFEKLIVDYSQEHELFKAYARYAGILFRLKRYEDGARAAEKVSEYDDGTMQRQPALAQATFTLAKCYQGLWQYDEAQEAFLRCALYYPWCHWNSVRAVEHLKGMNTYRRRYRESLPVAKLYFWVCAPDDKTMAEAVDFVIKTLQAVDGDRKRVEQFLLFQKHGAAGPDGFVGTADDLGDVLDEIELPEAPEREAALKVSREYYRWDYPAYEQKRRKGYLLLLTGQPKAAVAEFVKGYEAAPAGPTALGDATDDVLKAMKALTGNMRAGQRFLEFRKHGAAGPDGLAGTGDDLTDPVEELLGGQ